MIFTSPKCLVNGKSALAVLAMSAALVAGSAFAQQATEDEVAQPEIDPISFRGPNPTERFKDIDIQQNIGVQVPMDIEFRNEKDEVIRIGDLFTDKPVLLSMVYYGCPSLCTLVLDGMVAGIDGQKEEFRLGDAFTVISVSIDPRETGALATEKKGNYLANVHVDGKEANWHFLTGDEASIEALAETVGFRYYYDESTDQFAHGSGVMIATPEGKMSSYYMGIEYLPGNLRTALEIAGAGTLGKFIKQPSLLCYAYDPTSGTYGFVIMGAMRLGGLLVVLLLVAFWVVNYLASRKSTNETIHTEAQTAS